MKPKLLAAALALVLALALAACSIEIHPKDGDASGGASGKPSVTDNSGSVKPPNGAPSSAPENTPGNDSSRNEPLSLFPAYVEMPVGYAFTPECLTNPSGQPVEWSSSDTAVAEVSGAGKIRGVNQGEAVITVTRKDNPALTASCGVRVVNTEDGEFVIWETPQENPPRILPQTGAVPGDDVIADPPVERPEERPDAPEGEEPTRIDPEGETEVEIVREEYKKIMEKGYVWTIEVKGRGRAPDPENPQFFVGNFTLDLKLTKNGGADCFGVYTGSAKLNCDVDTSGQVLAVDGLLMSTSIYTGEINDISVTLEPMVMGGDVLKTPGKCSGEWIWDFDNYAYVSTTDGNRENKYGASVGFDYEMYFGRNAVSLTIAAPIPFDSQNMTFAGTLTRKVVWKRVS